MDTVLTVTAYGAVIWLGAGLVVALVLGRVLRYRDRQVPVEGPTEVPVEPRAEKRVLGDEYW